MKHLVIAILFFLAFSQSVSAHTFHTSLTRMDYNAEEKTVEVTIQVFVHDLETALERQHGKRVNIDKTPDVEKLILAYLADKFVFKNKAGEAKQFRWIGKERETDSVWIYVETPMPEGFEGATLENRIFLEMLNDQVNLVTARYNGKKTDLVFKAGGIKAQLLTKSES